MYGILTFHSQLNYGGVLQALALREVVESISGEETQTIDLWLSPKNTLLLGKIDNPYVPLLSRWRNKRRVRHKQLCLPMYRNRQIKTQQLLKDRMHLSIKAYRKAKDLKRLPQYKTIIVGSDQVWNPTLIHNPFENAYLGLTIPKSQRLIAYAASYGITNIPTSLVPIYQQGLKRFDCVSVRESSGARLHATLTNQAPPPVVLDPTLLLPESYWRNEIKGREVSGEPYILYYWIGVITQAQIDWCKRLALREKCRVIIIASNLMEDKIFSSIQPPLEVRFEADPLDFVALCAGAKKMVTNSFHGMIFTTIFKGKCALLLPADKNSSSGPSRFYDFTERYQFSEGCNIETEVFEKDQLTFVDISNARFDILNEDRKKSLDFLREAILPSQHN